MTAWVASRARTVETSSWSKTAWPNRRYSGVTSPATRSSMSSRAVADIKIGMCLVRASARIRWVSSRPSTAGIIKSGDHVGPVLLGELDPFLTVGGGKDADLLMQRQAHHPEHVDRVVDHQNAVWPARLVRVALDHALVGRSSISMSRKQS